LTTPLAASIPIVVTAPRSTYVAYDHLVHLVEALNAAAVRYLIVGGLAVTAHGYVRLTQDVDIVVDFDGTNEQRAIATLKNLGYRPRIPLPIESFCAPANRESWARDKDMIVFSVAKDLTEIDLFLHHPFAFATAYQRAYRAALDEAGTVIATFIGLDDLIAMKRAVGRPVDLLDADQLTALRAGRSP
jgi:hypothetical protein